MIWRSENQHQGGTAACRCSETATTVLFVCEAALAGTECCESNALAVLNDSILKLYNTHVHECKGRRLGARHNSVSRSKVSCQEKYLAQLVYQQLEANIQPKECAVLDFYHFLFCAPAFLSAPVADATGALGFSSFVSCPSTNFCSPSPSSSLSPPCPNSLTRV